MLGQQEQLNINLNSCLKNITTNANSLSSKAPNSNNNGTRSKLLQQLQKQTKKINKVIIDEDRIDDVYQILTKIQSKNLMLIQLLVFLIEKGFVRNQHKIYYYMDLYDSIKGIISQDKDFNTVNKNSTHTNSNNNPNSTNTNNLNTSQSGCNNQTQIKPKQQQEQKFTKKKFIKIFKQMAKKFYPCDPLGFQNNIYKIITSTGTVSSTHQHSNNSHNNHNSSSNPHANQPIYSEEVRIKIDQNVKRILSRETINLLRKYQRQLEIIYEIYLPENFNSKMAFSWQQIKYLEKKLPIIAVFRFLWECQICPLYLTSTQFFQITSKIIPPHSLLANSGQKQGLFYNPENIINYTKQAINQKKMKLLQGDIGVSLFQFQILLIKISAEIMKQKNDFTKCFENFINIIKLGDVIGCKGQVKYKPNKFEENVRIYFEENKKINKNSLQVSQKRQTKKNIQQILQINTNNSQNSTVNPNFNPNLQETSKNQFKNTNVSTSDLQKLKKSLDDDHLPQIPERPCLQKQKQNDKNYNIEAKHVVIGQQLPKIPQKNKPVAPPKKADKKDQLLTKYKMEVPVVPKLSEDHFKQMLKIPKKPRINKQFPIILMDIVYPNDIPNLYLNPKAQIYLETTYIHLGERSYQKAFINYCKAKSLCENSKLLTTQFYFAVLQAQIYEAAARDGMALLNYNKAKQMIPNNNNQPTNKDNILRYIAYKGLACCLFHIQQYQYSLRCFLKAKQLKSSQQQLEQKQQKKNEVQFIENAVLENNIGCIYMILNRNNQAMKCFELSAGIMDLMLGKFNQRSVVVQQNLAKNKKAFIQMVPTYKTMWKTYVQKPGLKPVVKATKKK